MLVGAQGFLGYSRRRAHSIGPLGRIAGSLRLQGAPRPQS